MSCTRRGFLKTIGAAMVGLGLTRIEPLRAFASSAVGQTGEAAGGPPNGPYSIGSLRARAVDAARWVGNDALAAELEEVCCWAPAGAAIRKTPLGDQIRGAHYFFRDFPGGDQLAEVMHYTNNTVWSAPRFRVDPEGLVAKHLALLQRSRPSLRTEVLTPRRLNGSGGTAQLELMFDRQTGERLGQAADRSEPMWAALSIFSGMMLDPTDELSKRLAPGLSLDRAPDRAFARNAAIRYNQIVIGAAQRAVWADMLGGSNPALPLVQLSAAGYLPLGEEDGSFLLLRLSEGSHLTGYRTGTA